MQSLLIATSNQHKYHEIKTMLCDLPLKLFNLNDLKIHIDVDENGDSFTENSLIKAKVYYGEAKILTLADDSGIVVPVLNNEPGIYSARYAGKNASDADNRLKVIQKMNEINLKESPAYFACSMTLYENDYLFSAEGISNGYVKNNEKGLNGFGYDPIFYPDLSGPSMAELSPEEKNKISHRKRALVKIEKELKDRFFV
jgi:XTP/dITP diphosphohydrolase